MFKYRYIEEKANFGPTCCPYFVMNRYYVHISMSTHIHDFFSRQLFRKWLIGQRREKWCSRHPISDYRYSEFNEAIFFIFSTYLLMKKRKVTWLEFPNLPPLLTKKMRRYLYLSTFCTLSLFSTSVFWKNIMRNVFSLQSKNGDIVDDRVKLIFLRSVSLIMKNFISFLSNCSNWSSTQDTIEQLFVYKY